MIDTDIKQNFMAIACEFVSEGKVINTKPFGNGNINDTFLVTVDSQTQKHFILQRINTKVFQKPELIMSNMRIVTEHIRQSLEKESIASDCAPRTAVGNRHWDVPHVILTQDGKDHYIDTDGSFWRAIAFIESSQSFDTIENLNHAREVGYALGTFHNLLRDLPVDRLADTLEGFHITPLYLHNYDRVLATTNVRKTHEVEYCFQFISQRRAWAYVLEDAKGQGKLPLRTIHGDPKINNIIIDTNTNNAIALIDLDTVKPGLIHYDLGDCLRSGCNLLGEETQEWEKVRFEPDLARNILRGYLSQANAFLTENDYEYMYDAIRLLAFELGLRFFTDYLAGNVYFKAKYKEHNLMRALVQFSLTKNIEFHSKAIRIIIKELK